MKWLRVLASAVLIAAGGYVTAMYFFEIFEENLIEYFWQPFRHFPRGEKQC